MEVDTWSKHTGHQPIPDPCFDEPFILLLLFNQALGLSSSVNQPNSFAKAVKTSQSFSKFLLFLCRCFGSCAKSFCKGVNHSICSHDCMLSPDTCHNSSSWILLLSSSASVVFSCSSSSSLIFLKRLRPYTRKFQFLSSLLPCVRSSSACVQMSSSLS